LPREAQLKLNARAGKKEGGWGEGIFARPRFPIPIFPPPNFVFHSRLLSPVRSNGGQVAKCAACLQFWIFGVALK